MNHLVQINHDNYYDESKTWTQRFSKLPDDENHWAPNNILKIRSKTKTPVATAVDQTKVGVNTVTLATLHFICYRLPNAF